MSSIKGVKMAKPKRADQLKRSKQGFDKLDNFVIYTFVAIIGIMFVYDGRPMLLSLAQLALIFAVLSHYLSIETEAHSFNYRINLKTRRAINEWTGRFNKARVFYIVMTCIFLMIGVI